MSSIPGITNNTFAFQPHVPESSQEKVQVTFKDMLEEVGESGKNEEAKASYEKSSTERFRELMDMSIGERYFELYLKQEGMTREEFEALPPEEQEKIVKKFQDEMETRMSGGKAGNSLL